MKRLSVIIMTLFLALTLIGCGQNEDIDDDIIETTNGVFEDDHVSYEPDTLRFTSMREFLESYLMVGSGRATGMTTSMASSVNLMEPESFYLPIGIPEEYQLYRLTICENFVTSWFLPEEYLTSGVEMRRADARQQHFMFSFTRWDMDSPENAMLGQLRITENDLIDGPYGKFHFDERNNFLWWTSDTEHIMMQFPARLSRNTTLESLAPLTQTYTLDLTNPAAIDALLATLPPSHHQLSFDMGADGARGVD
ncbi:MAG: hypothetical protein FWC93_03625, partial [Defluviitaleaceae bacterium]|nr:hypothetical protein [Defluviitaleaceae bacterium]